MLDAAEKAGARTVHLNHNLYNISYDSTHGVIYTVSKGFWSIDHTEAYFRALKDQIEQVRDCGSAIRVLVDRRGNPAQSSEVAARIRRANTELYGPTDRLAIVVDSSTLKAQLRQIFHHGATQAFLSYTAAFTWLTAF